MIFSWDLKKKINHHFKPEHSVEDAAVLYIYNINFVLLHFQAEEAASFHNP